LRNLGTYCSLRVISYAGQVALDYPAAERLGVGQDR
jgi:hypothetical protein